MASGQLNVMKEYLLSINVGYAQEWNYKMKGTSKIILLEKADNYF